MRGVFITFEGADGSGKSTQLRRAVRRLRDRGVDVVMTREPGGSSAGVQIRAIVLEPREPPIVPNAELLLIEADRAQHVAETILPSLVRGAVVMCDRFTDATIAYQGAGRGIDFSTIAALNAVATGGLTPDLTILFDVDVGEALRRLAARAGDGGEAPTRFDLERAEFHDRVRHGYLDLASVAPHRIRTIDANRPVDAVGADVDALVDDILCRFAIS